MFSEIIGNHKIKDTLEKIIESNKVSHSYLFSGIDGIGKKKIAIEFAKAVLCLNEEKKYCDNCKSCIQFDANNNPDFFLLEPTEDIIKIDQIREMQKHVIEKPIASSKKVYIIDRADTMRPEAQNCLLKTLEEPPEYVMIILISSVETNLLTTIKSRCTVMKFDKISDIELNKYLTEKYNAQNIDVESMKIFQGSIGKAIEKLEYREVYNNIKMIFENIENISKIDFLKKCEELYSQKDKIYDILDYINILFIKKAKVNNKYANCIDMIENAKKKIKYNVNFEMVLDNLIFNIWEEINEKYNRS